MVPLFAPTVSPIADLEAQRQRFAAPVSRPLRGWLFALTYGAALLIALTILLREFFLALLGREARTLELPDGARALLTLLLLYFIVYTVIRHVGLLLQTITAAASSIAREKESGTWELLLLTGVDARHLLWSKWWGTMRASFGAALLLVPLRAGLAVLLINTEFSRLYGYVTYYDYSLIPPNALAVVLVAPLIAIFTLAGVALAAAVGLLASVLFRRVIHAAIGGMVLYVLLVLAAVMVCAELRNEVYRYVFTVADLPRGSFYVVYDGMTGLFFTMIDNGTMLASSLGAHAIRYLMRADIGGRSFLYSFGFSLVGSLIVFPPSIWGVLRLAQAAAVRGGALRPVKERER